MLLTVFERGVVYLFRQPPLQRQIGSSALPRSLGSPMVHRMPKKGVRYAHRCRTAYKYIAPDSKQLTPNVAPNSSSIKPVKSLLLLRCPAECRWGSGSSLKEECMAYPSCRRIRISSPIFVSGGTEAGYRPPSCSTIARVLSRFCSAVFENSTDVTTPPTMSCFCSLDFRVSFSFPPEILSSAENTI